MEPLQQILLGSVLSVFSGAVVFWIGHQVSISKERNSANMQKATLAFSAISKLVNSKAWALAIKEGIDEQFLESFEELGQEAEPAHRVPRLLVSSRQPLNFGHDELGLALESGDLDLVTKLSQLEFNMSILEATLVDFNENRLELDQFIEMHGSQGKVDGVVGSFEMPINTKAMYDARIGVLHQLLASLIENSDWVNARSEELALRFRSSVASIPGLNVPDIRFPKDT